MVFFFLLRLHETIGGGYHNIPAMFGKRLPLSHTKNLPMFTLSPKTDPNRKVVISGKHV